MRPRNLVCLLGACAVLAGCGGGTKLLHTGASSATSSSSSTTTAASPPAQLGIPTLATKNTSRVPGTDPIADAAGVALAVYPSVVPGSHPKVVTLAPSGDWQAAIAASVLMAPPIRAPMLLSGSTALPAVTAATLRQLAPAGTGAASGAQLIRVGSVPAAPHGMRAVSINGAGPYAIAAEIDRFVSAAQEKASPDVVIASAENPAYAMPAAGWAAESGDPVLFVNHAGIPPATRQALLSHQKPHIYVLGPASVVPDTVIVALRKYGTVKRVGATDPATNSVAFAEYRDPPCAFGQPCPHIPGSFGWTMRSPGHGYVLINSSRPLDAAAAAALSGSGDYGPQLLVDDPTTLPRSVLNFFFDYATPGYTQEGPTAAVYNHGWVIGDQRAISDPVQAELDSLLEAVPQQAAK